MFSFFHMHTHHRQTQCHSQTCTRKMNEIKKRKGRTKRINVVIYKIIINTQTNGTKKNQLNNVFIRTLRTLQMKNARKSNRTANRRYKYLINCLSFSFLTGNYSMVVETAKKINHHKITKRNCRKIEMLFTRVAMQRLYPSA